MCCLLPISGVVLVVLTRGLVVSSRGCGSLLRGWPVSRVSVGYGFDGWSRRHPCASSQLRVGILVVVLGNCVLSITPGVCIWNHLMRTLLVALLLCSVMRVES